MKNAVSEYIDFSDLEKTEIWKKGLFVFDTNVLLNLYRYSQSTRNALIESITQVKKKAWIPHQVALEFMRNRPSVIHECSHKYELLSKAAKSFVNECQRILRLYSNERSIKRLESSLNKWIEKCKEEDAVDYDLHDDNILQFVLETFDNKVGSEYSQEQLASIFKSGKDRYAQKIPPGYKDQSKDENIVSSQYGDLIAWNQIMDYSKEHNKDIIFITEDQKEDWWHINNGKTLGARPELKRELFNYAGTHLLMYTTKRFITTTKESKGGSIDQKIIDELDDTDYFSSFLLLRDHADRLKNDFNLNNNSLNYFIHAITDLRKATESYDDAHKKANIENINDLKTQLQLLYLIQSELFDAPPDHKKDENNEEE